jgi:outer membrane murein-binding lipoprotein Lpp
MIKFLVIASAALLSVGCASKGSVEALSSRVDALEASHQTIAAEHAQLKSDHEAIKADVSSLSQKLDAAFVKKNLK